MTGTLNEKTELESVCVIGLGYVGLTLGVAMADAGYRIYGVEKDDVIREYIGRGRAHFSEPALEEHLDVHVESGQFKCSETLPAGGFATVYVVTVGTPLDSDGRVNLSDLVVVLSEVSAQLRKGDCVVLRSTVKTGTTRNVAKPILDRAGVDYDLAFCPERTVEGKALQELSSLPQVVGALDGRAAARAEAIFRSLAPKIIKVDSLEEAEMVKLVNNTQRDLMFAFANEIGQMCDSMRVSATTVIQAACEDYPRSKIPLPGPVGGPCLEKDPHILAEGLREVGYTPQVSLSARKLNENLPKESISRIADKLIYLRRSPLGDGAKVVILGLAFKGRPETNDLRGTMARPILSAAIECWPSASFYGFDPVVSAHEAGAFNLNWCRSLEDAFDGADLVLIQNNHNCFATMPLEDLMERMADNGLVFDYWNMFDPENLSPPSGRFYAGFGNMTRLTAE